MKSIFKLFSISLFLASINAYAYEYIFDPDTGKPNPQTRYLSDNPIPMNGLNYRFEIVDKEHPYDYENTKKEHYNQYSADITNITDMPDIIMTAPLEKSKDCDVPDVKDFEVLVQPIGPFTGKGHEKDMKHYVLLILSDSKYQWRENERNIKVFEYGDNSCEMFKALKDNTVWINGFYLKQGEFKPLEILNKKKIYIRLESVELKN